MTRHSIINIKYLRALVKSESLRLRPELRIQGIKITLWKIHLAELVQKEVSLAINAAWQTDRNLKPFVLNRETKCHTRPPS